jgi:hypothetical protein
VKGRPGETSISIANREKTREVLLGCGSSGAEAPDQVFHYSQISCFPLMHIMAFGADASRYPAAVKSQLARCLVKTHAGPPVSDASTG